MAMLHTFLSMLLAVMCLVMTTLDCAHSESNRDRISKEFVLQTHMSTKTLYPEPTTSQLAADDFERTNFIANKYNNFSGSCRPVQLNYVVRHGTRFPTIKDIMRIEKTHAKLRDGGKPLSALPWWVREWDAPYKPVNAGGLAEAGVAELVRLGRRLRARFGESFGTQFHTNKFVFEHTYKIRTQQSAMAFSYGFFGTVQPVHYVTDPIGSDHELRFFDNCPVFETSINSNKTATVEHTKYKETTQMHRNLETFRRLAGDKQLSQHDLEAAYAACAFDVAVRMRTDHWCSLFDEQMLYSMDYYHDLKHFYRKSHGNAMAFEIAAPLLQDMHRSMLARVQGHSDVEGHFRFAHAETILPLASLLNLSYFDRHVSDRDGHFLAETPLDVAMDRSFRGSVLAPFAGNIGFVLYECDQSEQEEEEPPTFYVQTLLHERTVRFPDCGHAALCPFDRFEQMFSQWIHEYDFFGQCAL